MTDFPPLPSVFALHPVPPGTDPLAAAMAMAPAQGAGTLAWQDGEDSLWAAVVLEPELPLATARIALLAAAAAAADALVVLGPPEIPVTLRWPATLVVNGGAVGTALLAVPPGCGEDAGPDWLVVGLHLAMRQDVAEPGLDPGRTVLAEEGFFEVPVPELVAAWARHLMAALSVWQSEGAFRLAERLLPRLEEETAAGKALDPVDGALLLHWPDPAPGRRQRLPLPAHLPRRQDPA